MVCFPFLFVCLEFGYDVSISYQFGKFSLISICFVYPPLCSELAFYQFERCRQNNILIYHQVITKTEAIKVVRSRAELSKELGCCKVEFVESYNK